jgi:hypothetical protein
MRTAITVVDVEQLRRLARRPRQPRWFLVVEFVIGLFVLWCLDMAVRTYRPEPPRIRLQALTGMGDLGEALETEDTWVREGDVLVPWSSRRAE